MAHRQRPSGEAKPSHAHGTTTGGHWRATLAARLVAGRVAGAGLEAETASARKRGDREGVQHTGSSLGLRRGLIGTAHPDWRTAVRVLGSEWWRTRWLGVCVYDPTRQRNANMHGQAARTRSRQREHGASMKKCDFSAIFAIKY